MISSPLSWDTNQTLSTELNPSETLVWAGQPLCNRLWYGSIPIVLFATPWIAFSVFWKITAIGMTRHASSSVIPSSMASVAFPLFGFPFILVGLAMLSTPYWMRRAAQKTIYALTNQHALILTPAWRNGFTVRSIPPEDLSALSRTHRSDGSGTLIFTRLTSTSTVDSDGRRLTRTVGFENIANVRDVETLIERTFRPPGSRSDFC